MYDDEMELNESQEVKNQRRTRLEELTLQFLEAGKRVEQIPRGKSAQRIYCEMNAKNKSASPSIRIEGDKAEYGVGQHPHSKFDFQQKTERGIGSALDFTELERSNGGGRFDNRQKKPPKQ